MAIDTIARALSGQASATAAEAKTTAEQAVSSATSAVPAAVTSWLNANVNPVGSAVVVDSSLSISGAAADAKATGDGLADLKNAIRLDDSIDLIVGGNRSNGTTQSVQFTWNSDRTACTVNGTNSSSSSFARRVFWGSAGTIPVGFAPGGKYYTSCTSTNSQLRLSIYFYKNGTYLSNASFYQAGMFTVPSDATGMDIAVGLRPSQTATNDVISNIAIQKIPEEIITQSAGLVGTSMYMTVQNTGHSSANDRIDGTFRAGETYMARISADTSFSFQWEVWAYDSNDNSTRIGSANTGNDGNGDFIVLTLQSDAVSIGFYTAAVNVAPFKVVVTLQKLPFRNTIIICDELDNYGAAEFITVQNGSHSSTKDQIVGSFKAGKTYIVRMNASTTTAFEWQVWAFTSGTGTKVATANTGDANGDQVRITLDSNADAVGIFTPAINESPFKVSYAVERPEPAANALEEYDFNTKTKEFAAKFNNTGLVDAFLWFTDPHLMKAGDTSSIYNNFMYYTAVLGGFYDRTPTQFALCGGDWIQWLDTQELALFKLGWITGRMKELFGDHYYTAVGNHDTDEQGTLPVWLSDTTLRNIMMPREDATYYSFEATNSRFYVLNTDTDHQTDMIYTDGRGTHNRWTQVEWLGNQLITNDDSHSVICMHIGWNGSGDPWTVHDYLDPFADYVQQLIGAYNSHGTITLNNTAYNFSTCSGKVGCILCGHIHDDKDNTTSYSVPVVATPNTQNGGVPTFDLVLIDWTANKMEMIRVGTGSNRSYNLA